MLIEEINENNIELIIEKLDYDEKTLRVMLPIYYNLFKCEKCNWIKVVKKSKCH